MKIIDKEYTKHPFYGILNITEFLRSKGHEVNHKRVERLMRLMGIQGICPQKNLSKPAINHKIYPYLLTHLMIDHACQVFCSDITFIPMRRGFMYLVATMDWFSRFILSWELSNTLDTEFCEVCLQRAIRYATPEIFNTDQGS